jgi:hypothetical protein
MSVLVLVHMRGATDRLLQASDRLADTFGMPPGLTAQISAPTDEGIVIVQLWESEDLRRQANEDPRNRDALASSGLLRETVSGSSEVCETDRVQLADVVKAAARRPRRSRARAAATPGDSM